MRRRAARVSTLAAALAACSQGIAWADVSGAPMELDFNADFLMDGATGVDLERFRHGNPVEPGHYDLDVHLNDTFLGRHGITFHAGADPLRAQGYYAVQNMGASWTQTKTPTGTFPAPDLAVRYIRTGAITPGTIGSAVTLTMDYP